MYIETDDRPPYFDCADKMGACKSPHWPNCEECIQITDLKNQLMMAHAQGIAPTTLQRVQAQYLGLTEDE
jgi:hypothetical protein